MPPNPSKRKSTGSGLGSQEEGVGRERFGSALAGGPVKVGKPKCFWSLDLSKRRTKRGHGYSGLRPQRKTKKKKNASLPISDERPSERTDYLE